MLWRAVEATPEEFEVEYAAALAVRAERDVLFASGVAALLAWAWNGSGPPLDVDLP